MDKTKVALLLTNGEATAEANEGAGSEVWSQFMRIRHEGKLLEFVQCTVCKNIFAHNSKTTGTGTLRTHMKCCSKKQTSGCGSGLITKFVKREVVSAAEKARITQALAKWCATSMRPFEIAADSGLVGVINVALKIGSTRGIVPAASLLPHPTTVSRCIQSLHEEERSKLRATLAKQLSDSPIYGMSLDFWKNTHTSESFVTVAIHHPEGDTMGHRTLCTRRFEGAKTGENECC
jgi:hypothetical protein